MSCLMKTLCGVGSVLLCGAMAVAFYHLVGKRGLGGRDRPETEAVPAGFTGTVQHDDGGGFRMVENINLPSSGYSLLSVLVCLVAAAVGGFLLWAIYRKYIDWRASIDRPADMMDMEEMSPPPTYSRAMRNEQRDARQRSQCRNPRRDPRRGQTHNPYRTDDPACSHPFHSEGPEEDDELERRPRIRSEDSSRTTSPQLPLAPRVRGSDTEARLIYAAASGHLSRLINTQPPQSIGGRVHIHRELQV
jgi:hypothetical protein